MQTKAKEDLNKMKGKKPIGLISLPCHSVQQKQNI